MANTLFKTNVRLFCCFCAVYFCLFLDLSYADSPVDKYQITNGWVYGQNQHFERVHNVISYNGSKHAIVILFKRGSSTIIFKINSPVAAYMGSGPTAGLLVIGNQSFPLHQEWGYSDDYPVAEMMPGKPVNDVIRAMKAGARAFFSTKSGDFPISLKGFTKAMRNVVSWPSG